jgi:hypothetical protein
MTSHFMGTTFDNKPPEIEAANKRFNKIFITTTVGMILYGLLLPTSWESILGPLALPIAWAAQLAPATGKAAASSPIPELVRGFYGLSSWVSVLFALLLASKDPLGERVRFAFSRPHWPFFKTFCFVYLVGLPFVVAGLWVIFVLPISIAMNGGSTWGMKLLVGMISDRLTMAFFGGIATATIGGMIWLVITLIVGPFALLLRCEPKRQPNVRC